MEPASTGKDPSSQGASSGLIPHQEPADSTEIVRAAHEHFTLKKFFSILGPGLITGASDDDPSGIGTYSAAGASFGYTTLWMAIVTFPLMTVIQYLCAKVGMVSGKGLAGVLKEHYAPWIVYPAVFALFFANTINVGADLGAIAAALNMFIPLPIIVLIVPVTLILLALQIWGSYRLIERTFRWLTLALFAYIGSSFFAHPDALATLQGTLLPTFRLDSTFLATLVAIVGTTISPYLFFWQSNQEVEEEISEGKTELAQRKGTTKEELRMASWDVTTGMFISNLVMYAIILATAATLFRAGKHDIQSATDAAQALRPIAGNFATVLFAIGLIGSGCLAVPVLAGSAAYAISEAFGWKYGLDEHPGRAKQFYSIIAIAMVAGMCMNFLGINPIAALFWTAVINGVLAPPLLVLLMLIVNNRAIMGRWTTGFWPNVFGWLTTILMFVAAIALILTLG